MKYSLLVLLLLTSSLPTLAQVESGNMFINGTVSFAVVGNDGNTQTAFTFNPTFGYLINDQLAVGGSLGVVSQFSDDNDLTVFLSPLVRWYLPIVDDKFYFLAQGSIAFSYGSSAAGFEGFNSSEDAFSVGLTASPGFTFFPAEHWSLDFIMSGLGLTFFDIGGEGGTTTLFSLGVTTLSPSLGFSYYF